MSRILIWNVTGMTCHSCEKVIGNILKDLPGVEEFEVSLKQGRAGVRAGDFGRSGSDERAAVHPFFVAYGTRDRDQWEQQRVVYR